MGLVLGIDTGGTYTDSAVVDTAEGRVLAKAKSFTTRSDLLAGILNSIDSLNFRRLNEIRQVSLSTTLATNAIVENRRGKTGLIIIGKTISGERMPASAEFLVEGLYDIKGREKTALDEDALLNALEELKRIKPEAVAVSGYASVRNPAHEMRVAEVVRKVMNVPVVCAHELSSTLGFEDRTRTAVFNAGLIPLISGLITSVKKALKLRGISAGLMIVKGDSSLMDENYALYHPVDTILSGPAASVLGGIFLSGREDAVVLDMGGTTTDIADVSCGRVKIQTDGADIGGRRLHVRAAQIRTYGIGGDSRIISNREGISIGPKRVRPLCEAAAEYPHLLSELRKYRRPAEYELFSEQETDCFAVTGLHGNEFSSEDDGALINILKAAPHSLFYLSDCLGRDAESLNLGRLVEAGAIERIGLTPTDLLHAQGRFVLWNREISVEALKTAASAAGYSYEKFIEAVEEEINGKLAAVIVTGVSGPGSDAFCRQKLQPVLTAELSLHKPLIAIGAPVAQWLPKPAMRLNAELEIPVHSEVANAVGAAAGRVMERAEVIIRYSEDDDQYYAYAPWGRDVFDNLTEAKEACEKEIKTFLTDIIRREGGANPEVVSEIKDFQIQTAAGNEEIYIETRITAHGTGDPDWK